MTMEETSKEEFKRAIVEAVEKYGLTEVAKMFKVSIPTVCRWEGGVTAPVPAMRTIALDCLRNK